MANMKKSTWEEEKIKEIWKDGKKFWSMIRELIGKDREKEEEAYIFNENGEKKEIIEIKEEFTTSWKTNVYQKADKTDFSFWYGKGGKREAMLVEEKEENSEIMKFPEIEEKELVDTINGMRNGKAAGIDGIKSELMKFIIKDDKIKKHTLKCFNSILKEPIHKDWCTSITTMIPKEKRPKILEHRPIAVTVNSSKIFWTIMREKKENLIYKIKK